MTHHTSDLSRRHVLAWTTSAAAVAATATVATVMAACTGGERPDSDEEEAGVARLDVVDSTGALLDFDGLREIQSNGAGEDGWDD